LFISSQYFSQSSSKIIPKGGILLPCIADITDYAEESLSLPDINT